MALKAKLLALSFLLLTEFLLKAVYGLAPCASWRRSKSGDTCQKIAKFCEISIKELYSNNPLLRDGRNCNGMELNTRLCCKYSSPLESENPLLINLGLDPDPNPDPDPDPELSMPACTSKRTVRKGDTCYATAEICRISLDDLYRLNENLEKGQKCGSLLAPGMQLCCKR
jgi:LysM domain